MESRKPLRGLTNEDIAFLHSLQEEMNTQDAQEQADPRFWVIKGTERVYHVIDEDGQVLYCEGEPIATDLASAAEYLCSERIHQDEYDWFLRIQSAEMRGRKMTVEYEDTLQEDAMSEDFYTLGDLAEWMNDNLAHSDEWPFEVIAYKDVPKIYPDTFFLTKKEAEEHLRKNAHHYSNDAHVYAMTAWRAPQVESLYKILHEVDFEGLDLYGLSVWASNGDVFVEHEVAPGRYACVKFPSSGMPYVMDE